MAAARSLAGTAATELLPVVHQPESRDAFPGLYSLTLPQRPFSTAAGDCSRLETCSYVVMTGMLLQVLK